MLQAKRLWLWHQAKAALKNEQAALQQIEDQQQHYKQKIEDLESKLTALPPIATTDDEIEKLLMEQELWVAKKEEERFSEEKLESYSSLEQTIHQRIFEILQLEQELSEEALQQYDRLAERLTNPVVEVRNKSCMGCFLPLSLSKCNEWRRGKGLVFCDECGRILV